VDYDHDLVDYDHGRAWTTIMIAWTTIMIAWTTIMQVENFFNNFKYLSPLFLPKTI